MTNNNVIDKTLGYLNSSNRKNIIVFFLIIFLGTMMAGRKQFILDPYEMLLNYYGSSFSDVNGAIHPLYSKNFYKPPALELLPQAFLFEPWFHVFSAITFWVLVIGGVFVLIKKSGLTIYQSMTITLFTLFVGNLIIRELFDITLLGPAPYKGYRYYSMSTFVVPLAILSLMFMFNRRFFVAGILVGIATFFHVKFGFRFFGLLFFSLLLWKLWGSSRLGLSQKNISWRKIIFFSLGWLIVFVITFLQINSSFNFLETLDLPRSQPLQNQLAWLIRNEPDDYLISYHFLGGRPFFGFLSMAIAIGAFCETILRLSHISSFKRFAIVWEIATLVAVVFFGLGFLFESFLIDWLPLGLAHSITTTRFWDLIWVVIMGFWITMFLAINIIAETILIKSGKPLILTKKFIFHPALAFFLIAQLAIFIKSKDAEFIKVFEMKSGVIKIMDYVQICDDVTPEYNKFYWMAARAIQEGDEKGFQEALIKLNAIYDKFKGKLENSSLKNIDSVKLNILNHLVNKRFTISIEELEKSKVLRGKGNYWWSCLHSEPGIHHHSHNISIQHYIDMTDWIKANVPFDRGIIQAPYFPKFGMFSGHIGFWDTKVDQHMMNLLKGYYEFGLHRLRSVAGPYAWEFEQGKKHRGLGPASMWYFLDLNENSIMDIQRNYPNYKLLLTENKNLKDYPVLYSNPSLILYDIS